MGFFAVVSRFHHFAINEKGDVYSWGLNNFGQTGIGHQKNIDEPTKIESLSYGASRDQLDNTFLF